MICYTLLLLIGIIPFDEQNVKHLHYDLGELNFYFNSLDGDLTLCQLVGYYDIKDKQVTRFFTFITNNYRERTDIERRIALDEWKEKYKPKKDDPIPSFKKKILYKPIVKKKLDLYVFEFMDSYTKQCYRITFDRFKETHTDYDPEIEHRDGISNRIVTRYEAK